MKETKRLSLFDWEDRKNKYKTGSDVYRTLKYMEEYRSLALEASRYINSVDGLGTSDFWLTSNAADLEDKRYRLESFCDGIFDEMLLEVDEPFAKAMGHLMDDLYEISPDVIKEDKKICGFIPAGKSLADLLNTVAPSEDLKNALKQKIEGIKEDEPQWSYGEALVAAYEKYFRFVDPVEVETSVKERFIMEYEALNENECKKYSKFLKCMNNETYYEDMVNIKVMTYSSEYAELLMRYTNRFKITNINTGGVFTPSKKTLVFNLSADRGDERGDYYTFFHEMGHAIDYFYGCDNNCGDFFTSHYKDEGGKTLLDYNKSDYQSNVKQTIEKLKIDYPNYPDSDWECVQANLFDYNRQYSGLTKDQEDLQKLIAREYQGEKGLLFGPDMNSISDIFGGLSENVIKGNYGHNDLDPDGTTYWLYPDGKIENSTEYESFAEYFSKMILSEPHRRASIVNEEKYMPKSKAMIEDILGKMGEGKVETEN